jgi:PAS domain S-box-containing protein
LSEFVGHRAAELREEEFGAALVEMTQCLVCVLDREGRILAFNRACEETTGYASDEVLGRDARDFVIPPDEAEAFGRVLADVWATGRPSPQRGHWMTRDGGRRLIAWTNKALPGPDGEVLYLAATGLDVTELDRAAGEQAALRRVATLVASGPVPERVFETVTEESGRLLGAQSAAMLRYDDAETGSIVGRWTEGDAGGFPVGAVLRIDGNSLARIVYETGRPGRIDGYEGFEGEIAEAMRQLGYRSSVAAPIIVSGRIWGALVAASALPEPLPPDAEGRLGDFAELVGLALASTEAREQLAASRVRILEAGDAARRRIERNLHDGAQQRLVSLALTLRLARARLAEDPPAVEPLLAAACEELEQALDELRELARGIHPAVLSEHGLGPALAALAGRAPFPVDVTAVPEERLPPAIEAAAYYVVSEALANVAKYAEASRATARVAREDGRVVVEIADDGRGGADPAAGSGLCGLADRAEALGGGFEVVSPPGRGTTVRAELPLP